jgi:hypothetical protein
MFHSDDQTNDQTPTNAGGGGIPPIIRAADLGAPAYGTARHLVLGERPVLRLTIANLHKRGYAEPNDWSQPLPTGREAEYMVILTKQVPLT